MYDKLAGVLIEDEKIALNLNCKQGLINKP